ncbi:MULTISPECIES: hypothetical protein [unclassified Methylobacterium]|uniref:hypothetical protein n=1 Tax=unclassified Methylobacterium TaxID=2615210 RepID=UPI001FCDB42E|nr:MULTISPECIES: hypothetical protein [unclassified Methylobacterium]
MSEGDAGRFDEGQIMQKGRPIPAWLARRTYFKRIGRWTKPGKVAPPPSGPVAAPMPSNVVPFPVRMNRPDRPVLEDLRVVGTA